MTSGINAEQPAEPPVHVNWGMGVLLLPLVILPWYRVSTSISRRRTLSLPVKNNVVAVCLKSRKSYMKILGLLCKQRGTQSFQWHLIHVSFLISITETKQINCWVTLLQMLLVWNFIKKSNFPVSAEWTRRSAFKCLCKSTRCQTRPFLTKHGNPTWFGKNNQLNLT